MNRSLYVKIVLILVLMIVSVMAVVGAFLINGVVGFYINEFSGQMTEAFTKNVEFVTGLRRAANEPNGAEEMRKVLAANSGLGIDPPYRNFYILDSKTGAALTGSDLISDQELQMTPNMLAAISGRIGDVRSITDDYIDVAVPITAENASYIVYIKDTKQRLTNLTTEIFMIIIQALIVGLTISVALALLLSKTLTTPIENLTRGAKLMAAGDFSNKLLVHSRDEIGILTQTFNNMAQALKDTLEAVGGERDKLETLFLHLTDGVAAFGKDGSVLHINPAAMELLRARMDENPTFDKLFGRYVSRDELAALRQPDFIYKECHVGKRDLKLSIVTFGSGESEGGYLAIIHDVTEERRLDAVRREFVANVSHELRTPLTSIRSYGETLLDRADIPAETQSEFLRVILNETDRMTRIVKDLLTLSQMDYGKIEWNTAEFSPEKSLRDIINAQMMEAKRHRHDLTLEITDELPKISGDRERIEQVLINIVSNSIKYTPDGGKIKVTASMSGDRLRVAVRDNGIGIPESDIPRLFERFYRVDKARSREFGGTGLGLAIAREIVEHHHGAINVESAVGQGTEVAIELPVTLSPAEAKS